MKPSPPLDVLLFVFDPSQQRGWQPTAIVNNDWQWLPLRLSTADPSKVTFVSQSSALKLAKQSQDNLRAVRQSHNRIKKRAQLTAALESNKRDYELAKQQGEVSDVGAMAIERDRIEEELAKMEVEDKEAERHAQQQQQQAQHRLQEQQQRYGYSTYGSQAAAASQQAAAASNVVSPTWSEQVTVYRTIDLPFGYCRFGQGANAQLYNIVKVQQIDIVALPMEQVVTISKSAQ